MKWPRWLRLSRRTNGTVEKALSEAQAKVRKAERDQWVVEHLANRMAQLPDDELVTRIAAVFRQPRT